MDPIRLHDTFLPGQHISDAKRFCGRKEQIKTAVKALSRDGASIVVYGDRGVGKSSFVEMVKLIAQDQASVVYDFKFHQLLPKRGFQYKVVSIECDSDTCTSEKVLQRLLTSPQGFGSLIPPRLQEMQDMHKAGVGVALLQKVFSANLAAEHKEVRSPIPEDSVVETFSNVVKAFSKDLLKDRERLLIVIDEFDRVGDTRIISSLIKTLSKDNTKFLIAGIAASYHELLSEHTSIHRQLDQGVIALRPMGATEIEAIFKGAEEHNEGLISFNRELVTDITTKSFGYPYFVHLFGQIALDEYVDMHGSNRKGSVSKQHLTRGLTGFAERQPTFEKTYREIVNTDPSRELMLQQLASQIPGVIQQDQIFRYCSKRGVPEPKRVLAQLLSFKSPVVLVRKDRDTVAFNDPLFRAFAAARPPVLLESDDFFGWRVPGTRAEIDAEPQPPMDTL
jgi:Cdc6-like AAA superfamily ATPase